MVFTGTEMTAQHSSSRNEAKQASEAAVVGSLLQSLAGRHSPGAQLLSVLLGNKIPAGVPCRVAWSLKQADCTVLQAKATPSGSAGPCVLLRSHPPTYGLACQSHANNSLQSPTHQTSLHRA